MAKVEKFFKGNTESITISATEEVTGQQADDDIPDLKIKTGNIIVKIKHKKEANESAVTGIQTIDKFKCFVNKFGEKPRCLRCNEIGHIRKNCPKNSMLCLICKKTGHLDTDCNMALKTANPQVEFPDEDDTLNGFSKGLEDTSTGTSDIDNLTKENVTAKKVEKLVRVFDLEVELFEAEKRKRQEEEEEEARTLIEKKDFKNKKIDLDKKEEEIKENQEITNQEKENQEKENQVITIQEKENQEITNQGKENQEITNQGKENQENGMDIAETDTSSY